jgi:hypothetical protein
MAAGTGEEAIEAPDACTALVQARRITTWAGDGRKLTARGLPRRPDLPGLAQALDIQVPQRVRTSADLPQVHIPWLTALTLGWITVVDGTARAAATAHDPVNLDRWADALAGVGSRLVRATDPTEGPAWTAHLLDLVDHNSPTDTKAFETALFLTAYAPGPGPTAHRRLRAPWDQVAPLLALLDAFGTLVARPGGLALTGLGRRGLEVLRSRVPAPLIATATGAEVLDRLARTPEEKIFSEVYDWLADRTPAQAARELLDAAPAAGPLGREAAMEVIERLGDAALPALHKAAADPGTIGPWLAYFLSGATEPTHAELSWFAVEGSVTVLEQRGAPDAYTTFWQRVDGDDLAAKLTALHATGHPDADQLARHIAQTEAEGQGRPRPRVLQLKITLNRFRPAVWRRVLITADSTLEDLHHVIQAALAWDGSHLHLFTLGDITYSDSFFQLDEARCEHRMRLDSAFDTAPGASLGYIYDLGDRWDHTVTLERVLADPDTGQHLPCCTSGSGDSPVEDWSQDWAEEDDEGEGVPHSRPFDQLEVNSRLARLR